MKIVKRYAFYQYFSKEIERILYYKHVFVAYKLYGK